MPLEKELLVASVFPVCFQWSSSGLLVVFQCVHWIATGTPLGASIRQCGSSGIPVYSWLQWYSSAVCPMASQCTDRIWFGGHQVRSLPSMQPLIYTTGMERVVRAKLISFDLQLQIRINYNGAHIKGMLRVMFKYSHVLRAELVSIAEQWTPSKGWIHRDLSTCSLVCRHLVISNWHMCYSICLTICAGVCVGCYSPSSGVPVKAAKVRVSLVASQCGAVLTKFLHWHFSVGLFQLSFSSGVPVYPASNGCVAQWYPSVHWVNQWHSSGIPVYTGPASVHWLKVRDTKHGK